VAKLTTAHPPAATYATARTAARETGLSELVVHRVTTAKQMTKSAVAGEARTSTNAMP
jgi:hypothetical protein